MLLGRFWCGRPFLLYLKLVEFRSRGISLFFDWFWLTEIVRSCSKLSLDTFNRASLGEKLFLTTET